MNQGKLDVVKQEVTRVNIDILGISELKWTGMGEFDSDDNYIYYCGQESLRRYGVTLRVNKRVQNVVLGCNLKNDENDRMISVHFWGKPLNITVIQVCAPTTDAKEAEVEWFYKDRLELTPKTDVPFILEGRNAKVGNQEISEKKKRDTWSNRKVWPWSTKWSRAKANRVLSREHIGHCKHHFPIAQEMTLHMDITRWSILNSEWLYSFQ